MLIFVEDETQARRIGLLVIVEEGIAIVQGFFIELRVGLTYLFFQIVEKSPCRMLDAHAVEDLIVFLLPCDSLFTNDFKDRAWIKYSVLLWAMTWALSFS